MRGKWRWAVLAVLVAALIAVRVLGLRNARPPRQVSPAVPARTEPPASRPIPREEPQVAVESPSSWPPFAEAAAVVPSDGPAPWKAAPAGGRSVLLLLRDSSTGEIVRPLEESFVRYTLRTKDGPASQAFGVRTTKAEADGRVRITVLPPTEGASFVVSLQVIVEGYEREDLDLDDLVDRAEVSLDPWTPRAQGTLVLPEGEVRWISSRAYAEAAEPSPSGAGARGLPRVAGPFAIYDLLPGRNELEVTAMVGGVRLFARRSFDWREGTVDLGEVRVEHGATLRARILDGAGRPRLESRVSLRRKPPGPPLSSHAQDFFPEERTGTRVEGGEGWFLFEGLVPGARYLVHDLALPGAEAEADAPDSGADPISVDVPWKGRMVRCRLRFTVRGRVPEGWGPIGSASIPESAWRRDGTIDAELSSGRHWASVEAIVSGNQVWFPEVIQVPDQDFYEAVIDLGSRPDAIEVR